MKKKIIVLLAVAVFVISLSVHDTKAENLMLSESSFEFYTSERQVLVLTSESDIDESKLQIKSKDVKVELVGCENKQCLLSFSGFEVADEKVEINYEGQSYYFTAKIKAIGDIDENAPLDEQYKTALAQLFTKHRIVSTDEVEDEKLRTDIENEIESLKDKYTDPNDVIDESANEYEEKESQDVGLILLTKNASTSGIIYGHAGIHTKFGQDVIETRGFNTPGVKVYINAVPNDWKKFPTTTGVWNIKSATLAKRRGATTWAYSQKGKPYGFDPSGTKTFFCTKLVWMAWESQKVKIGHYWFATDMMASDALKVKTLYHK